MDPDPDPGDPKTRGSGGSGFGSATLLQGYSIIVLTESTHLQGWFVPAAVGCVERPAAAEIFSSARPVCSSHI